MAKKVKKGSNIPTKKVELMGQKKQFVLINGFKVEAFIPKSLLKEWKKSSGR